MGTFLKYVIYAFVLIAVYLIGVGLYEGSINGDTTISKVGEDVENGTKKMLKDGYQATKDAVEKEYDRNGKRS